MVYAELVRNTWRFPGFLFKKKYFNCQENVKTSAIRITGKLPPPTRGGILGAILNQLRNMKLLTHITYKASISNEILFTSQFLTKWNSDNSVIPKLSAFKFNLTAKTTKILIFYWTSNWPQSPPTPSSEQLSLHLENFI